MIILQDELFFNHNLERYAFSQKILEELNFQFKSIHGIKGPIYEDTLCYMS